MIGPRRPTRSPRRASLKTRKELLDVLGVPLGSATVARRPMPEGDTLVVRVSAASLLPPASRPAQFQGFPVTYEIVPPLKTGSP
jgi:hypothetical protein